MTTSRKQTSQNGEEKSIYSQGDFLASRSVWQGIERGRKMTATSGRKCYEQYGKYSPLGSLVKTLLESYRWYSPAKILKWSAVPVFLEKIISRERRTDRSTSSKQYVKILKERDIPSSRLLFRLVPSERRTGETEYGLLPTVTSTDKGSGRINRSPSPNASQRPTIAMLARIGLLPTPMSTEVRHANRVKELKEEGKMNFRSREKGKSGANGLMDYMDFHKMFPTPTANDAKNGTLPQSQTKRSQLSGIIRKKFQESNGKNFQLNPLFVQEMMGFPYLWTELPFQSGDKNL